MTNFRPLGWILVFILALGAWIGPQRVARAAVPSVAFDSTPTPDSSEVPVLTPIPATTDSPAPSPSPAPSLVEPKVPTAPVEPQAPPVDPVLVSPADGATVPLQTRLEVAVDDDDGDVLDVAFFGRSLHRTTVPTFTLVALPDTQYYSCGATCGSDPAIFAGQSQWVMNQLTRKDIRFVGHLGDIVEFGDLFAYEWENADAAMSLLEAPQLPGFPDGVPYALAVGNHDQLLGTARYNNTFGIDRFVDRLYYGGHYGVDNNNHYSFFEAHGLDFIVISLEYDSSPDPAVLDWASGLLDAFPGHRAIILAHYLIDTGDMAPFGPQGEAIYSALSGHPNLFLMLGGHIAGEGQRQDVPHHHTVHTLLADYQNRPNGGNGWLRILELDSAKNRLVVRTYTPLLDQYELDADSYFTLAADLQRPVFERIGTRSDVAPGSTVTATWSALQPGERYEWYVTVSDGTDTTVGPIWYLSTAEVITKTAVDLDGPPLVMGDEIQYEVTVTNPFTTALTGVAVTDTLPAGVVLVGADPPQGTGANPLVWEVGDLAAGATWVAVITVTVDGTADPIGGNVAEVRSNEMPGDRTPPILPPGGGWLGPRLSIGDTTVIEGDEGPATATVNVTLSVSSTHPVTVTYQTQDGTAMAPDDYLATTGMLEFSPGMISLPITVTIWGDTDPEVDEHLIILLSAPVNGVIEDGQGRVIIASDDAYHSYLPLASLILDPAALSEPALVGPAHTGYNGGRVQNE